MLRYTALAAVAACLYTPAAAQTTFAKPLNMGGPALMPSNGTDGIVIFRIVVSETGRIASYELLEEYPKGKLLPPGRADSFMKALRYKPALKDGVAVTDEGEIAITRDDKGGQSKVRPAVMEIIKAELEALRKHDTSGTALDGMADMYAKGSLTFSELAWYFYLQAPLNRMQRNFAASRDAATKASDISRYLPKGKIVTALQIEAILGKLGTEPARALTHYDGWLKRESKEVPPALTELIERYRAAPEKDYSTDIAYFGEAKPLVRESAAPGLVPQAL